MLKPKGCMLFWAGLSTVLNWPSIMLAVASEQNHLENIQSQMQQHQQKMNRYQRNASQLTQQLEKDDQKIAALAKTLWQLQQDIQAQKKQLQQTHQKRLQLNDAYQHHQKKLAEQLRQFILHAYGYPQTPWNLGGDPLKLLNYYDYLNTIRVRSLQTLAELREHIQKQQSQASKLTEQLKNKQAQSHQEKTRLQQTQKKRLARLETQRQFIEQHRTYLADLQQASEHLSQLTLSQPSAWDGLLTHKKKLIWPVQGTILAMFGQKKSTSRPWNGLLIASPEGTPIQAIAPGRVVFASWLEHYGMVVILDHGADYMTLYGHNQTLLVSVDQDVKQGEKIALLGRSGFQIKPALYFEIRHQGRAINPQHWLPQAG